MATTTEAETKFRKELVELLRARQAHLDFQTATKDFSFSDAGYKPASVPHSAWELLEHMRITQRDILDFASAPEYKPLKWPDEYWPPASAPKDESEWHGSIRQFEADLQAMIALAEDRRHDLNESLPNGKGQTLLREILLVADHNSHHLGQFLFLKKMLPLT